MRTGCSDLRKNINMYTLETDKKISITTTLYKPFFPFFTDKEIDGLNETLSKDPLRLDR